MEGSQIQQTSSTNGESGTQINNNNRKRTRGSTVMEEKIGSDASQGCGDELGKNERLALGGMIFRYSEEETPTPATTAVERANTKRRKSPNLSVGRQLLRSSSISSEDSDSSFEEFSPSWSAILQNRAENSLLLTRGMQRVRSNPTMASSASDQAPACPSSGTILLADRKGETTHMNHVSPSTSTFNDMVSGLPSHPEKLCSAPQLLPQSSSMPTMLATAAAAVLEAEKRMSRAQSSESVVNTKAEGCMECNVDGNEKILNPSKLPAELQILLEEGTEYSNNNNTNPESFLKMLLEAKGFTKLVYHSSLELPNFFLEHTEEQIAAYDNEITSAVRREDITEMRRLMKNGHTMQCANRFGETILHIACRRGSLAMVKFLVEEGGASMRVRDDLGRTVLHDACWTAKPALDVMNYLLQFEPQLLWVTDKRGFSPLGYARRDHWDQWCNFLLSNRNVLRGPCPYEIPEANDSKRQRKNSDTVGKPMKMMG